MDTSIDNLPMNIREQSIFYNENSETDSLKVIYYARLPSSRALENRQKNAFNEFK